MIEPLAHKRPPNPRTSCLNKRLKVVLDDNSNSEQIRINSNFELKLVLAYRDYLPQPWDLTLENHYPYRCMLICTSHTPNQSAHDTCPDCSIAYRSYIYTPPLHLSFFFYLKNKNLIIPPLELEASATSVIVVNFTLQPSSIIKIAGMIFSTPFCFHVLCLCIYIHMSTYIYTAHTQPHMHVYPTEFG